MNPGKPLRRTGGLTRRTPIQQRTPLARGGPIARKTEMPRIGLQRAPAGDGKPVRPRVPAQRSTGPTAAVRRLVEARDGGRCVPGITCAGECRPVVLHHRRNRAMGGSTAPDTNQPQNLVACCNPCNLLMEMDRRPGAFDEYRANGWKVRQGRDPAATPARYPDGRWYLLDVEGGRTEVPPDASTEYVT